MPLHLILGGARSGKSRHAEQLAQARSGPVSVIVTALAGDPEMQARIARHQADRPAGWSTVEAPLKLAEALRQTAAPGRCVIVDCLTLWLSNQLCAALEAEQPALLHDPAAQPVALFEAEHLAGYAAARAELLATLPELPGEILLVANEVGFGLVPETPLGRLFRDEAGRLNQSIAALGAAVTLVVAGLPLTICATG